MSDRLKGAEIGRNTLAQKGLRFAVITGVSFVALTGCGNAGNGASVEKCGTDEGTEIKATFAGSKDYEPATDPAVLVDYSVNGDGGYFIDPEAKQSVFATGDQVDVIGEVACQQDEQVVLSVTGAQVQQAYLEKPAES